MLAAYVWPSLALGSRTSVLVRTAARYQLAALAHLVGTARAPSYNTRRHYLTGSCSQTLTTKLYTSVLGPCALHPRPRLLIYHAYEPSAVHQSKRCQRAHHHGDPTHLPELWRVQCVSFGSTGTSASRHNLLQVLHDVCAAGRIHLDRKARALYAE